MVEMLDLCSVAMTRVKRDHELDLCANQEWKGHQWLLVSDLAQKELGSHYFILTTSKNLNKLKIQQILDYKRSKVTRQITAPQIGEANRQILKITTYWSRNTNRTLCGNQHRWTKAQTVTDQLLEAQDIQVWEFKTQGGAHTSVSFTSRISTRLLQWYQGKQSLMLLAEGRENKTF